MNDAILRVAKAIQSPHCSWETREIEWKALKPHRQAWFLECAKAAIIAMRAPYAIIPKAYVEAWHAMFDEVLEVDSITSDEE